MRRRSRVLVVAVTSLALVGAAIWLGRDLPRRRVEALLCARLGTPVRLAGLAFGRSGSVTLLGLELRRPAALPALNSVEVERAVLEGGWRAIAAGVIERLELEGVRLVVGRWRPPRGSPSATPPAIGTLVLRRASLVAAGTEIALEGEVRDPARAPVGELYLHASRFDLGRLVRLVAGVWPPPLALGGDSFSARLALRDHGRRAELEASARGLVASVRGHSLELGGARCNAFLSSPAAGDGGMIEARCDLDQTRLELAGRVDGGSVRLGLLELEVDDLGAWSPLLLPPSTAIAGGRARLRATPAAGGLWEVALEGGLERLERPVDHERLSLAGITLRGAARVDHPFGAWRAELELGATAAGLSFGGWHEASALAPLEVRLRGEATTPTAFHGRLVVASGAAGRVTLSGRVESAADAPTVDAAWRWSGAELAPLLTLLGSAPPPMMTIAGRVRARGRLSGELTGPLLEATLVSDDLSIASPDGPLAGWGIELAGTLAEARVSAAAVDDQAAVRLAPERIVLVAPRGEPLPLALDGRLRSGADGRRRVEARLDAGGLGRATVTASERQDGLAARVTLEGINGGAALDLLRRRDPEALAGYSLAGEGRATLELETTGADGWRGTGRLDLEGCGFLSDDGGRVGEGFAAGGRLEAAGRGHGFRLTFEGPVRGGQLLWGTLFADYAALSAPLAVELELAPGDDDRLELAAAARLEPTAGVVVSGRVEPADAGRRWGASLEVADLASATQRLVRGPLAGSRPLIDKLVVAGSLAANVEGRSLAGGVRLDGRIKLADASLAWPGFAVTGLELELPIGLELSTEMPGPRVTGEPLFGRIGFAELALGAIGLPPFSSRLLVAGDEVAFAEPLRLPLFGGEVELDRLTVAELARPTRHLATGLAVRRLDLGAAARALGVPPLAGTLDGELSRVVLDAERLETEGGGELRLFGGRVHIGEISGRRVLSRYPRLRFSASLEDIDLARLTETVAIGEISGVLEGEVRSCELFRGTPVSFEARLETVRRPGVPQRISLRAINTISIVGSGSGLLRRGFLRLFDRYRYASLGIEARLADDRFLLRGLAERGGRELFLKGALPVRVDVVNAEPGKTVSFSTMLERLDSVEIGPPRDRLDSNQ